MCDAIIAVLYDSDLFALGITMEDVEDVLRDTCEDWAIGPVHCQGAYYPAHRHVYAKKMPNRDATNYLFSLPLKTVCPVNLCNAAKSYVMQRDEPTHHQVSDTLEFLWQLRDAAALVGVSA